jgi:hypothetical protein
MQTTSDSALAAKSMTGSNPVGPTFSAGAMGDKHCQNPCLGRGFGVSGRCIVVGRYNRTTLSAARNAAHLQRGKFVGRLSRIRRPRRL